jgi:hypothetical protein
MTRRSYSVVGYSENFPEGTTLLAGFSSYRSAKRSLVRFHFHGWQQLSIRSRVIHRDPRNEGRHSPDLWDNAPAEYFTERG